MNIKLFSRVDKNKYLLIKSPYLNKKNKFIVKLAKSYDSFGYMKKELGEEIESLFNDPDYMIGIHRTGYSNVDDKYLYDVFNRGLINNMDLMQGISNSDSNYLDIEKTVTLFNNFVIMNAQLKSAYNYKGSAGCVIVKIPKSYLGYGDGEVKPIYYKDKLSIKLLPEFVYGYIPVSEDGVLGDIVHNPNYSDEHNYVDAEDSLLYESNAIMGKNR